MSPYQKFVASVKEYFESVPVLKVFLNLHAVVFGAGGVFYLLGAFLINTIWSSVMSGGLAGLVLYDVFTALGVILIWAGLLLSIIADDSMLTMIISAAISVGSLIAWIVALVGINILGYHIGLFLFEPLLYCLLFGGLATLVFLKSDKFREIRAAAAKPAGVPCPKCGATIPASAGFCPTCGTPNPGPAPAPQPAQAAPQYAPPVAPQPAQAAPQYASPVAPQPAQAAPQYAPPVAPQPEPQPEPIPAPPVTAAPAPEQPAPAAPAVTKCINCGTELPAGAMFCGKCGTKQQ